MNFNPFKDNKPKQYPLCPFCKTEMCQVSKKGENTYYECLEIRDGKPCYHREWEV